jgi:hypothetical protein
LEQLRKHLLPNPFDPTGNYSLSQYDQTRGYIALVHAEIEAFIEIRCLATAAACVANWLQQRKPSAVVIALHAVCYSGWDGLLTSPQFKKATNEISVEARLSDSLTQYKQAVGGNNGIKEPDLKRLLVPLSIRMNDLDSSWISAMDSFGQVRGQVAHQSSVGVQQQPDPKDLRRTVWKDIVPGLRALDLKLTSLVQ